MNVLIDRFFYHSISKYFFESLHVDYYIDTKFAMYPMAIADCPKYYST